MTTWTTCLACGRVIPAGARCCRRVTPARAIRGSRAWHALSAQVRAVGMCAGCGAVLPPALLEADHVIPASSRPDLALEPDNVRPLCRTCHVARRRRA